MNTVYLQLVVIVFILPPEYNSTLKEIDLCQWGQLSYQSYYDEKTSSKSRTHERNFLGDKSTHLCEHTLRAYGWAMPELVF